MRERGREGENAGSVGVSPASPLILALSIWALALGVVMVGAWTDRGSRSSGPEATVAAYTSAVERSDVDAALATLVPGIRESSASWVAWQMGNRYHILESAVRTEPLGDRLLGRGDRNTATVVVEMEIEGKGNPSWRTVAEIPARLLNGKWLLEKPPLEGL